MNYEKMKAAYDAYRAEIEVRLDELIPEKDTLQGTIYKAMRYSLLAGGKRVRPVMTVAMADLLGAEHGAALDFACALEMIHTYSLIHDDLPAMDNDDLRRGRPTSHKVFGDGMAVLAGDALLNKAFEVMSETAISMKNKESGIKIIADVSKLSGTEGMIGGQVIDIEGETLPAEKITEARLTEMCRLKTGALLTAPAMIAIDASGCDANVGAKLTKYCALIGLSFQIWDDVLDVTGDEKTLGKPIHSDEDEHKVTFVNVYGVDRCTEEVNKMTAEAAEIAKSFGEDGDFLLFLTEYLLGRKN